MSARFPRVFNIAAGLNFLAVLADAVLQGFPVKGAVARPLSDWTILLPNRRTARAFNELLLQRSGKAALILPRVKPIGDLDEDRLQDEMVGGDLPPAMGKLATRMELMNLCRQWANENQLLPMAQEILTSPQRIFHLAQSLEELVVTAETHSLKPQDLAKVYDIDIAAHRQSVTGLLELILRDLPKRQAAEGKMSSAARRNAMIRAEARRIAEGQHRGPIIAAGSTGSMPATRDLLLAIARHDEGAVVLPGLDLLSDDAQWHHLKHEHPQHALKLLLGHFGMDRKDVQALDRRNGPRQRLCSEMFRPTEATPEWHKSLPRLRETLERELQGITEITAPDRHLEARSIAIVMRETLTHPSHTAALVTSDRDLATRVSAELERWKITVFDSAGEPIARRGLGAALDLLLQTWIEDFAPASLFAFLRHPLVNLGFEAADFQLRLQQFELAVMRGPLIDATTYAERLKAAAQRQGDRFLHPTVQAFSPEDWAKLPPLAEAIDHLVNLSQAEGAGLSYNISAIEAALHLAIDQSVWNESSSALLDLIEELKSEAARLPQATATETAHFLRQLLQSEKQPPQMQDHPRLAILGTLEARLLAFDVLILAGLNETTWPKPADPGPWLNRSMRLALDLPLPETALGQEAHDFEQGLSASRVVVTWSKRFANAPQSPSRWLLRLHAVLETAGAPKPEAGHWLAYAQHFHQVSRLHPLPRPNFAPPVTVRPKRFSVTEVEKLIRNPYAIYAKRILGLEPLAGFAEPLDARQRGILFHLAIANWNSAGATTRDALLSEGEKVLAQVKSAAEKHFWQAHFRKLADFLALEEASLRSGREAIVSETRGELNFKIDEENYTLTARPDRIDLLANQRARIIDYKTGKPPTADQVKANFSPQLTLEAAMIQKGAFAFAAHAVEELVYFQIGGGRNGLKKTAALEGGADSIATTALRHLSGFESLLLTYTLPTQPYLPRVSEEREDEPQDYDHLSRFLEWQLAEQK